VNVLYLTAEVPYPLTSGYLRHFHFLRGLARTHAITHLSLTRRRIVPPEAGTMLAPFVERLEVFGAGGAAGGGRLRRSIRLRRAAGELRQAVAEQLARGATDVVLLSGKDTFPALQAIGDDVPLVVDVCDAASLRLRGELAIAPLRRRPALALRLAEIERVERTLAKRTPHLLFASERDRSTLGTDHGVVVPNGIDLAYWTRRPEARPAPSAVAFSGVMSYRPNHDAARRLVEALLPAVRAEVPDAEAVIAGRDPLPALRDAATATGGVQLTGECPDLRPHLDTAAVYCAPLRFASGIQNKLLEAMALELPVVTTEIAAAGLRVDGEEPPLIVADTDEAIVAAISRLLRDPDERARLGVAARAYVERHFSWPHAVALLDGALSRAAAERSSAGVPARSLSTATPARS
jgi:glycosyltransferase involved in cell wall biosynthesis